MTLDEQRALMETIYRRYDIRIVKWTDGLQAIVESVCPRSDFDFYDSLAVAMEEVLKTGLVHARK